MLGGSEVLRSRYFSETVGLSSHLLEMRRLALALLAVLRLTDSAAGKDPKGAINVDQLTFDRLIKTHDMYARGISCSRVYPRASLRSEPPRAQARALRPPARVRRQGEGVQGAVRARGRGGRRRALRLCARVRGRDRIRRQVRALHRRALRRLEEGDVARVPLLQQGERETARDARDARRA